MTRLRLALAWSLAAVGIAFWVNTLTAQAVPEVYHALLLGPFVEEVVKYLAIRRAGGYALLVPAIFVVGEIVVQQVNPVTVVALGAKLPVVIGLYSLFSLFVLAHFLFYAPIVLWGPWGLPVAIALHSAWNWYALLPGDTDAGPLGVLALAAVVLVPFALWGADGK